MKPPFTYHLAALIGLTILVYFQTLQFDFVNWDDDFYVINNLQVTNPTANNLISFFTSGNTANYHPITMLSLTFNYWLGQENAMGYHLVNLIFHLLNTALLFQWVKKMWPRHHNLPIWVAGVFALHPMHVESVAWISSRKDVLFFFFYFVGILSYLRYKQFNQKKFYWFTLLAFVCSGLSKPTAVIFPIHLLLIDYLMLKEVKLKSIFDKIPFLIVSIIIGLATVLVQNDAGAVSTEFYSFMERIQLGSYALNMYVFKFFAPLKLSSFYPYPDSPFNFWVAAAPLILISLLGLVGWKFKTNKNVLFGILFFLVSLALLIQLVTVGSTIISERYTYLAYVGLSISVYFLIIAMAPKTQHQIILWAIPLIALSMLSFNRTKVWKNGETLWTDAIEKFPQVAGSWGGRGVYYRLQKDYPKALNDFNKAISLNPNEAMFYSNRGNIYFDLHQDNAALDDYNNCILLDTTDQNAYANRGAIWGRKRQYPQAISDLNKAIQLDPNFVSAYSNRALIYAQLNQRELAKADYHTCLYLQPKNDEFWNALAIEHQYLSEFDSSLIALNNAIEIAPSQGIYYLNRGISLRLLKRQSEANNDFNYATKLGVNVNQGYYQPVP